MEITDLASREIYNDMRLIAMGLFGKWIDFPSVRYVFIEEEAVWYMKRHLHFYWKCRNAYGRQHRYCALHREMVKRLNNQLPPLIYRRIERDQSRAVDGKDHRPWTDPNSDFSKWRKLWANPDDLPTRRLLEIEKTFRDYDEKRRLNFAGGSAR